MGRVDDILINTPLYDALKDIGVKEEDARKVAMEFGKNDLHFMEVNNSIQGLHSHIDHPTQELCSHIDSSTQDLRNHMKLQTAELKEAIADAVNELIKTFTIHLCIGLGLFVILTTLGIIGMTGILLTVLSP